MRFWFCKKKNNPDSSENNKKYNDAVYNAVLKNREAIDALEKKQIQVEKKIKQMEIEAKNKVEQNQINNAKILLKRKKLYEQELQNILNNRLTLEDNMINLENIQLQKIAVNALSYSAITHKKLNNELNGQKVEKILDTIHECKEIQEEVNQALNFNLMNNIDDDEIEKELNSLKEITVEEKITENLRKIPNLPDVPKDTLPVTQNSTEKDTTKIHEETDDEELKELIGEMT